MLYTNKGLIPENDYAYKPKYDEELIEMICDPASVAVWERVKDIKLDSDSIKFLQRELTLIKRKQLEAIYPEFLFKTIFPVAEAAGPGLGSIESEMTTYSGEAEIISGKNTNYPLADFGLDTAETPVRNLAIGWQYSIFEAEKAARARRPLRPKKALAAREGTERKLNKIYSGLLPDKDRAGLPGLFTNKSNLITTADTANGVNILLAAVNFSALTGAQKLDALLDLIDAPVTYANNNALKPDTLCVTIGIAQNIMRQRISDDNPMSVADFIIERTGIQRIIGVPELSNASPTGFTANKNYGFVCKNDPSFNEIEEPVPYTPLMAREKGLYVETPARADCGGLVIYRKSIAVKQLST